MMEYLRSYIPAYFSVKELVSPYVYSLRGEKAIMLMDSRILYSLDTLRVFLTDLTPQSPKKGSLTVNNWSWGGKRRFSGLRVPDDKYYKKTSKHSHGQAIDAVSNYYSAEELRDIIIENRDQFPHITCIEMDVSWLHIDCRNLPADAPEGAIMLVWPDGRFEYI